MGDIADMMIEGDLCAECGVGIYDEGGEKCYVWGQKEPQSFLGGYNWGIPRHCLDCGPIDPQFKERKSPRFKKRRRK